MDVVGSPSRWRRLAPAFGLFVLAPATAEYLAGYDTSTGDFWELVAGLWVLAPLYGAPAILIREAARRTGRGWPTILLLGLAFGVVQAGLVDHSLFNASYRDIEYWDDLLAPTYLPALGVGGFLAVSFILGHAVWSIGAPIAVMEAFVPERAATPWLGRRGLAFAAFLYVAASALILMDHVESEHFVPTPTQLSGAAATALALAVAAFAVGRRPAAAIDRPAPNPWLVGFASTSAFSLPAFAGEGWWGVAATLGLTAALATAAWRWSHSERWGPRHRLALAAGPLLTRCWEAFLIAPLGDVSTGAKLAHNVAFALGVVVLLAAASRVAPPLRTPGGG
ncbi:hypothetical protein [Paludisphaera soli]|uniref:hypothetical protein n=1 Tax=Paludisphaera soli TaxID=2712865 RepID=UPI0013EC9891|nr:hypothetical protein [Paludisphaera soli]